MGQEGCLLTASSHVSVSTKGHVSVVVWAVAWRSAAKRTASTSCARPWVGRLACDIMRASCFAALRAAGWERCYCWRLP